MSNNYESSLQKLTSQDMGIIVSGSEHIIVCNWTEVCPNGGLPTIGPWREKLCVHGEGKPMIPLENPRDTDNIRSELPEMIPVKVYDINDALPKLLSDAGSKGAMVYKVECYGLKAKIIAPVAWQK